MAFRRIALPLAVLMCPVAFAVPSSAEVVIIGNKNLKATSVTLVRARAVWLGQTKALPGGERVTAVDLDEGHPARVEFYEKVVEKTPKQLRAYWAKKAFTKAALPPKEFPDEAAAKEWVAKTLGGLAYVSAAAVDDTVKVLLRVNSNNSWLTKPAETRQARGATR